MKLTSAAIAVAMCLTFSAAASADAPAIGVGFSPEGSAQQLILRTLDSARESIRLMGYSFISPEVVRALVAARRH